MATRDDPTLLCVECGYDLTGLDPDADCPECALEVARSRASWRRGSPWQRGESLGWLRTAVTANLYPVWTFRRIVPDREWVTGVWTNAIVALVIGATPCLCGYVAIPWHTGAAGFGWMVALLLLWAQWAAAVWISLVIGVVVVAHFERGREGGRGPYLRIQLGSVVAHATLGWVAGACVAAAAAVACPIANHLAGRELVSPGLMQRAYPGVLLVCVLWFLHLLIAGMRAETAAQEAAAAASA